MTGRIRYEVTHTVVPELLENVFAFMQHHFSDVVATLCFDSASLERSGNVVRLVWITDRTRLDRFQREIAPPMRAEVKAKFPSGIESQRQIFDVIESWGMELSNDQTTP
jgi:hypothetical protein